MIRKRFGKNKEKKRILIMAILLILSFLMFYYFHIRLLTSVIFTHFFYIPIIFACIWWQWKGILVALFLSLNLIYCHFFFYACPSASNLDMARPAMFIVVAFLIVKLRKETLKAEKETKHAYNEISQIFRTTGNGLRVIDRDFNMIRFNDVFWDLSGLHRKEATGKKCFEAFPSPECHTPNCILHRVLEDEERVECNTERERSDGSRIFCTLTATPLRGPEGEVFAIVEDIKDITDRMLWEEKLKRSEERYRSL